MTLPVTIDDVRAAAETLRGVAITTPVLQSRALSALLAQHGADRGVYLKCENVQRAGSFKIRGAYVRISRLTEAERSAGVVAASAGNHAQGVALASSLLGGKATVFMPEGAPLPKVAATRSYGADVIFGGPTVDSCLVAAEDYAATRGATFIHPFDHPDIIAGQGTAGLEILQQVPDVKTIVVGMGGGGLAAGLAVAVKSLRPDVRIVGIQAERAAPIPASLAAGRPVVVSPANTMADGIAVGRPGDLTYEIIAALVDSVLTVTEESLSQALLVCLERSKQVVEPAGAAGVAALLEHPRQFEPPVVAILSGGNIDPLLLSKVLRHGLAGAGRYLMFRATIPDRPGALMTLLRDLADLEANVLDVMHERVAARLSMGEVEVVIHVETRGPEHCDAVLGHLRAKGYQLRFS